MKKSTSKKKNKKENRFIRLIIITVLFIIVMFIAPFFKGNVKIEIVQNGTEEEKISCEGYILRNETVIPANTSGVLSCIARDGERVTKGSKIATVYSGNVDEQTQNKLKYITERINALTGSLSEKQLSAGDSAMRDSSISNRIDDVVTAAIDNETKVIIEYKEDIKRLMLNNNNSEEQQSNVDILKSQKEEIENGISGEKKDLYTDISGVFCSKVDGYEDKLAAEKYESFTPAFFKKLNYKEPENNKEDGENKKISVKVVDNYEWYFCGVLDSKKIGDSKVGDNIYLRFPGISSELYDATVYNISEEDNGQVSVVVACNKYIPEIYSIRKIEGEIVFKSVSGYKISKNSVVIKDNGEQGVFVVKDETAVFKHINVLYSNEESVIVEVKPEDNKSLVLYDEVILNSSGNISEGQVVRK